MAYALGRPIATGLKGLSVADGRARCEQEVPGGRDIYDLPLPAVVSVLEGINLPRYPSVPAKLRARSKPVESSTPGAAGAAAREGPPRGAARPGQAGGGPRQRARRPRRASWRSCARSEWPDEPSSSSSSRARTCPCRRFPSRATSAIRCTRSSFDAAELGPYGVRDRAPRRRMISSPHTRPAAWAACLDQLIDQIQPDAVVAAGTNRGNEVLGHLAARRDLPFAANCIAVGSDGAVTRVRWGGCCWKRRASTVT